MSKILLIEDDPGLGEVLSDQLEMNGYEVNLLRFPLEAVKKLQEGSFDLVIMDKLLNGIDGTRICSEIRSTEGIGHVPILMMSGFDGARQVCIAAGANHFIEKPFGVSSFLESIEATIKKATDLDKMSS